MGSIGALALVANFLSVAILLKYRDCDSNVRSVWLFSRNDVLAAKNSLPIRITPDRSMREFVISIPTLYFR